MMSILLFVMLRLSDSHLMEHVSDMMGGLSWASQSQLVPHQYVDDCAVRSTGNGLYCSCTALHPRGEKLHLN